MAEPGLILFDDLRARGWEPFALTRPAGELMFGAMKLVERAERALGLSCIGYLTGKHLADFQEHDAPSAINAEKLSSQGDLVYWCARAALTRVDALPDRSAPAVYVLDDQPVGYFAPAGQRPDRAFLDNLKIDDGSVAKVSVEGRLLEKIWDLIPEDGQQLSLDLSAEAATEGETENAPEDVHVIGEHALLLGAGVRIEPGSLFDLRDGPVSLRDGVEVYTGTRLVGPAVVGPHSRLLGGSFKSITTGPFCYLRGEISESVILGYTNKAHDGYLGHSYVGRWVNLGAFTTNSDLKNNYHSVRVWTPLGVQDTGRAKLGCFLGDHVKTGIGLLLTTGTVVGAGSNLFGGVMPPRHVPPFSWGAGGDLTEHRLADFLDTASKAMARRGIDLDSGGLRYLERCWRKGRGG